MERWVSTTPLGRPVEPLVGMITSSVSNAMFSGCRPPVGLASRKRSSSARENTLAPGIWSPTLLTTSARSSSWNSALAR